MLGALDVPGADSPDTLDARAERAVAGDGWLLGAAAFLISAGAVVVVWAMGQHPPDTALVLKVAVLAVAATLAGLTVARERAMSAMAAGLRAERARVVDLEHRL